MSNENHNLTILLVDRVGQGRRNICRKMPIVQEALTSGATTTVLPTDIPRAPWQHIHVDFADPILIQM
ncbi:hypothetical protein GJ496_001665 [Pomphorhynchus laevis]|nr:hypothetical protein GJ496_001665 [Pomphorhynchus laevis]